MQLEFKHLSRDEWLPEEGKLVAYLKDDNWDDYTFKTLYQLIIFDENGTKHDIGHIKIGYFGQEERTRTEVPKVFAQLDENFFSLGQGDEYYQNIKKLSDDLAQAVLDGLNDIVQDDQLCDKALEEKVTAISLLRGTSTFSLKHQYKRILDGGAVLTDYKFEFAIPEDRRTAGLKLKFIVDPESNPPSNIHILIGRNGVGKTHILNNMVKALIPDSESGKIETTSTFKAISDIPGLGTVEEDEQLFAGVVSVSFSAFDPFEPYPEQIDITKGLYYSYVGLKRSTNRGGKRGTPMSHEMLTNEFVDSLKACKGLGKSERWKTAIQNLESDPLFSEMSLSALIDENGEELPRKATSLFKRMSSGHGIVLLIITKLVEKIEEKTLVLIDEPEGHLHPPLLSAFVRSLSDLLLNRNAVAIIATHSPVIVQEVPKSCVWKLRRTGLQANAERPEIETFGENVGILTREIFGLEVTESGYHTLLQKALNQYNNYEEIIDHFGGSLGIEARGILRALLAERNQDL